MKLSTYNVMAVRVCEHLPRSVWSRGNVLIFGASLEKMPKSSTVKNAYTE